MQEEIKVSVIIPVYNVELYLADCLDSVIAQPLKEMEIICINDCSEDTSREILEAYARCDKRIKIIDNEVNCGLASSRNRGIETAGGKYICFLDSDDMLVELALSELYEHAEAGQADVVFFNLKMLMDGCSISEDEQKYCTQGDYPDMMTGYEFLERMYEQHERRDPVWLQFWNRERLNSYHIKFIDGIVHEDMPFTYVGLLCAKRVSFLNRAYYIYRRRKNSITIGKISEHYLKSLIVIYQYILTYWCKQGMGTIDRVSQNYLRAAVYKFMYYLNQMHITIEQLRDMWGRDSIYSYWLSIFVEQSMPKAGYPIALDKLRRLQSMEHLIIYGAGKIADRCLRTLLYYGIEPLGVAVTNMDENPQSILDIEVRDIHDYLQYRQTGTILICVGQKLQDDVAGLLEDLQFSQYEFFND